MTESLGSTDGSTRLLHTIEKGPLLITVTEYGNLESAENLDIRCQVSGGSSIGVSRSIWTNLAGIHTRSPMSRAAVARKSDRLF